jgi:hypothetical protein
MEIRKTIYREAIFSAIDVLLRNKEIITSGE